MRTSRTLVAVAALIACALLMGCKGRTRHVGDKDGDSPATEVGSRDGGFGTNDSSGNADAKPHVDDGDATASAEGPGGRLQGLLHPVYFSFDKSDLTQESRDILAANARALRDTPDWDVWVEGHCDERGTNEYNLALGDRRARVTRDYLVAAGIPARRMTIISYGEEKPFASGHDEASWAQNRTAHFTVKGQSVQ